MAFNLKDFSSNFYNNDLDIARSNLFSIHINPNNSLYSGKIIGDTHHLHEETNKLQNNIETIRLSESNLRPMILLATGVTTPVMTIQTEEGTSFHSYPKETTKGALTVTFLLDSKMLPLMFFTEWMNKIRDPFSMKYNFFNNYIGSVTVYTYDPSLSIPKTITHYIECYPISITTPNLSWGDDNKVLSIDVTFDYRAYFISSIDDEEQVIGVSGRGSKIGEAGWHNSSVPYATDARDAVFNTVTNGGLNKGSIANITNITNIESKINNNIANYKGTTGNSTGILGNLSLGVSGIVGQANSIINSFITNPLNAIQTTQGTIFGNIQKLRLPISNVSAQVNIIKNIPKNTKSQINTIKF